MHVRCRWIQPARRYLEVCCSDTGCYRNQGCHREPVAKKKTPVRKMPSAVILVTRSATT